MAPEIRIALPTTGSVTINPTGELDAASIPDLDEAFARASGMHLHVIVDLAEVTFMDGSVIGALLTFRRQALARGGSLVLVSASPWISKVLRIARAEVLINAR